MSTPGARTPSRAGGLSAMKKRQNRAAVFFIGPFVVVFVLMLVVPLVYAGVLSLFRSRLVGDQIFVGLGNYTKALTDPDLLAGVGRVAIVLVVQVPIMLAVALLLALALDSGRVRGTAFLRLVYFLPYAVPGVIAALMWGYLYGPDFGPISQVFEAVGLTPPALLAPGTILGSIMNIVTWSFIGYNMIVLFSALRSVPAELYEAAEIDGASQLRVARSIKIPAIKPALMLTVIFSIIGSFQLFNEPNLLRSVAGTAISSSYTPNLYVYTLAFTNQEINYAAAIAFLLGLVIAVVSYIVQLGTRSRDGAGERTS